MFLLMDKYASHTSIKSIDFARSNGICMLSFHSHATHKLQPPDVGIFRPFKIKCVISYDDWLISNPGKAISVRITSSSTKVPFWRYSSQNNKINSFRNTILWIDCNSLNTNFEAGNETDRPIKNWDMISEENKTIVYIQWWNKKCNIRNHLRPISNADIRRDKNKKRNIQNVQKRNELKIEKVKHKSGEITQKRETREK